MSGGHTQLHHPHHEKHLVEGAGWLRAAVLGANDGIISTGSLLAGVAASAQSGDVLLITGLAAAVAGAMSMAAGEYVSVASQKDSQHADLERERHELKHNHAFELEELKHIYIERGVEPCLAEEVARQMMAKDALEAHARDELGITDMTIARPVQAALASAASFSLGAAIPLLIALLAPATAVLWLLVAGSVAALAALGAWAAHMGGARVGLSVARITGWGVLAMAITAGVGALFHVQA